MVPRGVLRCRAELHVCEPSGLGKFHARFLALRRRTHECVQTYVVARRTVLIMSTEANFADNRQDAYDGFLDWSADLAARGGRGINGSQTSRANSEGVPAPNAQPDLAHASQVLGPSGVPSSSAATMQPAPRIEVNTEDEDEIAVDIDDPKLGAPRVLITPASGAGVISSVHTGRIPPETLPQTESQPKASGARDSGMPQTERQPEASGARDLGTLTVRCVQCV